MRRSLTRTIGLSIAAAALALGSIGVSAEDKNETDGKFQTADGVPVYNVKPDGTVDWYTISGFRRYHAECHVCHGPDGMGSSYAPALANSLKTLTYEQFQTVVINGKKETNLVMPAFGTNKNVYCYLDDIYVYLKARADDAVPRGRPAKSDKISPTAKQYENECMGS